MSDRVSPARRVGICAIAVVVLLLILVYGALTYPDPGEKPPAAVVDIDGTIAHYRGQAVVGAVDGSVEILNWLGGCGVKIFYLSSRPIGSIAQTRRWLDDHGFPPGQVIHKSNPRESRVDYKSREIRKIQDDCRVLFGIGDKLTDLRAYRKRGIIALDMGLWWWDREELFRDILNEEGIPIGENLDSP